MSILDTDTLTERKLLDGKPETFERMGLEASGLRGVYSLYVQKDKATREVVMNVYVPNGFPEITVHVTYNMGGKAWDKPSNTKVYHEDEIISLMEESLKTYKERNK